MWCRRGNSNPFMQPCIRRCCLGSARCPAKPTGCVQSIAGDGLVVFVSSLRAPSPVWGCPFSPENVQRRLSKRKTMGRKTNAASLVLALVAGSALAVAPEGYTYTPGDHLLNAYGACKPRGVPRWQIAGLSCGSSCDSRPVFFDWQLVPPA